MLRHSDVLVVVPAWNEAASITNVVRDIRLEGFDVLVVDDGSEDRTSTLAKEAGARVLRLPFNLGVGGALRLGFKFAVANEKVAVIQVDADGQHSIGDIHKLMQESNTTGADMVIGSRFLGSNAGMEISRLRRLAMRLLAKSASRAAGTRLTDTTSGFRLIRQPLLGQFAQAFPMNYLGDTFEAVVSAGRAGYSVEEIATEIRDRRHGQSSASSWQAAQFTVKAMVVALLHLEPRLLAKNPSRH